MIHRALDTRYPDVEIERFGREVGIFFWHSTNKYSTNEVSQRTYVVRYSLMQLGYCLEVSSIGHRAEVAQHEVSRISMSVVLHRNLHTTIGLQCGGGSFRMANLC